MRWIRFSSSSGKTAYGIVDGDLVIEVAGDPFAGYEETQRTYALHAIKVEVPVIPGTFYCADLNYTSHIEELAERGGQPLNIPKYPDVGLRTANALIAHQEPVVIPHDAGEMINFEGELVVVIGKRAKNLTREEALSCVLGYTIGNDVSERNWQFTDRTRWRAKDTDTFKPMGPWIETDVDLDSLQTVVHVNRVEIIRFATNDMVFSVADYIATMTRYVTLKPGDVIWMGANGSSPNLRHGDVVDVEITGIGTLRNPFVREGE